MQETINNMSTALNDKWTGLTKRSKLLVGGGAGALVCILLIVGIFMSMPNLEVIYSDLTLEQAAEIAEVLEAEGIVYEVTKNGTAVEVSKKQATTAKIVLARENIPKGSYTFEDAMDNSMSTTETEKNAKLHRLKETELENALALIDGIRSADVTLVIPEEKNSFIESKQQSSASVLVNLSHSLTKVQVEGVARFVASSVQNLDVSNINIIDAEGNQLYIGGQTDQEITYTKQQEMKQVAEQEIKDKVIDLLSLNYDEILVSPNISINFDYYEESREEYFPLEEGGTSGVIKYEKTEEANQSSTDADRENPTYQEQDGTGAAGGTVNREYEYENSKVVSNLIRGTGEVDLEASSLAVYVYVNQEYRESLVTPGLGDESWYDFKQNKRISTTTIEMDESIEEAVKKATGIEDSIVIAYENPIFVDDITPERVRLLNNPEAMFYVGVAIGILVLVFLLGRLSKKSKKNQLTELEDQEYEEYETASVGLDLVAGEAGLGNIQVKDELETQKIISKFAAEKPEITANILRNWIAEEDESEEESNE